MKNAMFIRVYNMHKNKREDRTHEEEEGKKQQPLLNMQTVSAPGRELLLTESLNNPNELLLWCGNSVNQ